MAHKEASFGGRTGKASPDEKACSRCFKKSRRWAIFGVNDKKVLCMGIECGCWQWMVDLLAKIPDYLRALGCQDETEEKQIDVKPKETLLPLKF